MRRLIFALLLTAGAAFAAEAPVTLQNLTLRADTGDRTAMRALADAYYTG